MRRSGSGVFKASYGAWYWLRLDGTSYAAVLPIYRRAGAMGVDDATVLSDRCPGWVGCGAALPATLDSRRTVG